MKYLNEMDMTHTNDSAAQRQLSLTKRIIVGYGIGLLVICFFILSADKPDPAWGKFWVIRPLIITPLAGAMGGLCNYILVSYRDRIGLNKMIAVILSVIIFIIGLFMGIVLGLDGTMWD
jgi:cytochrome bd-type quinol oxidase subunit 2